jgi:hypothetical protein
MDNWLNNHFLDTWIGNQNPIVNNIFSWGCIKENVYAIEVYDSNNPANHILVAMTDSRDSFDVAVKHA